MEETPLQKLSRQLRASKLDLGGDVKHQRRRFALMAATSTVPEQTTTSPDTLGGVEVLRITAGDLRHRQSLLYFHGGAYAIGSATASIGLAGSLSAAAGIEVISVDYRLAPEHPYPAALNDGLAVYEALSSDAIAGPPLLAGESAGGGLALAVMAAAREGSLPRPPAAILMSPWVDFELRGSTLDTKAKLDPLVTPQALHVRTADYLGQTDPAQALPSLAPAALRGLPPLLIQTGSHEILLDDSLRLAAAAAHQDIDVRLDVVAGAPHVFQAYFQQLPEAVAALQRAGAFITEICERIDRPGTETGGEPSTN